METNYLILKQCQQCGSTNNKEANTCSFCGYLMLLEVAETTWKGPKIG